MPGEKIEMYLLINPKGTNWCSFEVAQQVSDWIVPESQEELANMLFQGPGEILWQMKKGLTLLAIRDGKVVGHITLWRYKTAGWDEIGSLIIDPLFRGQGIGTALIRAISASFPNPVQLTATVKTDRARRAFCAGGFVVSRFDELRKMSDTAWRQCCPCYSPPEACPKRDRECKLLIRKSGKEVKE